MTRIPVHPSANLGLVILRARRSGYVLDFDVQTGQPYLRPEHSADSPTAGRIRRQVDFLAALPDEAKRMREMT